MVLENCEKTTVEIQELNDKKWDIKLTQGIFIAKI